MKGAQVTVISPASQPNHSLRSALTRQCLKRRLLVLVLLILGGIANLHGQVMAGDVTVKVGEGDTITVAIDGDAFATYNYGGDLPKPFFLPIRTASGTVINRALNDQSDADHPHHKGLWVSVDEINEQKHWAEKAPIVNTSTRIVKSGGPAAVLEVVNEWRDAENKVAQVVETTRIAIHSNRLLVYEITFTTNLNEAIFEDTKEGLLGFRVAPSMKEKNGGRVVSSDGTKGTKECWGKPFPWIDYVGEVEGKTVGVTLMDDPGNFRPSRYHVRDYGLFSLSPFGEKAYTNGKHEAMPVHLKKGEKLSLRYGVYLHDGDTEAGNVAAVWEQFSGR
ncbi:MAG: PmoA family protein [Planctomycetaceae bacterium]